MALTAWAQEEKAKREAWYEIGRLKAQLAKANERISQYESKQDKGADLLIKLAKSNASMASLELELAKANERVRECQKELVNRHNHIQELRQESGEYAMLIANLVRRADVKTDLLQNSTFEKASVQLNKFAIEKKADEFEKYASMCEAFRTIPSIEGLRHHAEQLRNEQE